MKESPEETFKRCCEEVSKKWYHIPYIQLTDMAQAKISHAITILYHSERKKIESPTDEEIYMKASLWYDKTGYHDANKFSFIQGFKEALELLNK